MITNLLSRIWMMGSVIVHLLSPLVMRDLTYSNVWVIHDNDNNGKFISRYNLSHSCNSYAFKCVFKFSKSISYGENLQLHVQHLESQIQKLTIFLFSNLGIHIQETNYVPWFIWLKLEEICSQDSGNCKEQNTAFTCILTYVVC